MERERLYDLDRAKGLGIFLVVLGHIVADGYLSTPPGAEWYPILQERINQFHMPFFMFVAGAIAGHTWSPLATWAEYVGYLRRRAARLLPAYFVFSMIVFVGKIGAQHLHIPVDNPVESMWSFFVVVLYPLRSFSKFLWFVYILFLLYAALPVLLRAFDYHRGALLLLSGAFQFCPTPEAFGLDLFREHLFFFLLGFFMMCNSTRNSRLYETIISHVDRFWLAWLILLVFGLTLTQNSLLGDIFHFGEPTHFRPYKIIFGLVSIPALIGLVRSPLLASSQILMLLGSYTFAIYLMNTMSIGLIKTVMLKVVPWDGINFPFYASVFLVFGILCPILVKKYFFPYVTYLDKITN